MKQGEDDIRQLFRKEREKSRVRPKIGLLATGHFFYWPQFPELKAMSLQMYRKLVTLLEGWAELVMPELVDTA